MNVGVLLTKAAGTYRDGIALEQGEKRLTYEEFDARVNSLSNSLLELGLKKGDKVGLILHNCPQVLEAMYASFKTGFVVVPMNVRLNRSEFAYMIGQSDSKAILFGAENKEAIDSASRTARQGKRHLICLSDPPREMLDYEKLVKSGKADAPKSEAGLDDVAWLFYTSGTTGKPKGAMLTHRNLISMTMNFIADVYNARDDDIALHQAPLSHGSGLYSLPLTARGATNVISPSKSFDVPLLLETIAERKVTILPFLTPTMIKMVILHPRNPNYDTGSLRCIVYGGSPMYEEDLKAAMARFGRILVQIYGQAEAPMTISYLPKEWHAEGKKSTSKVLLSAGIPRTDVRVKIFGEDGTELPPNNLGEIVVEGDVVMKGYWKNPSATSETLAGGWLHTGDLGYVDERGFLYIMDRKKDLIKSGGENIYPREVEEVILQHPAVREVAVFGVPDHVWGESVKAIVVLRNNMSCSETEIIEFCKSHIASYKKPKSVEFADSIPKSAYGKVLKQQLRDRYWEKSARRV